MEWFIVLSGASYIQNGEGGMVQGKNLENMLHST